MFSWRELQMKNFLLLITTALFLVACTTAEQVPTQTNTQTATNYPTKTNAPAPTSTQVVSPTPEGIIGCVKAANLNIRSGPGTQYNVLDILPANTCVTLRARNEDNSWVWEISEKNTGWISSYYLSSEGNINNLPLIAELTQTPNVAILIPTPYATILPSPTIRIFPTSIPIPTSTFVPTIAPTHAQNFLLCNSLTNYIGQSVVCKIPSAYCSYHSTISGQPTFCNDGPYPNYNFTLVVWGSDWSNYNGHCLLISGYVSLYRGKLQIVAVSQSQVSYCE
jgi:hypothetical protein